MKIWIAVSAVLLSAQATFAQSASLEANVIYDIEHATDPQVSPDGKRIVYARFISDRASDARVANLWLLNTDQTGHTQLTQGRHVDFR
ncbi:MAG: S9 family peptidase, partial [Cyanobacteria bacterium P01_E01_bin.43]